MAEPNEDLPDLSESPLPLERPRLWDFLLSEHDHGSICISSSYRNGAAFQLDPRDWLDRGYEGIRIIGTGAGPTHLRCTSHDGVTLWASRHPGVVRLENIHLHSGFRCASQFGEPNHSRVLVPKFRLELSGCQVTVEAPTAFGRTKWGLFTYQADLLLQDVLGDAYHASEHLLYSHGFARHGALLERVESVASGAETFKFRNDPNEILWAGPRAWIRIRDSSARDWYQLHSDRGGAAVVVQGGGCNIEIRGFVAFGGHALPGIGAHQRSKAIMISSEPGGYSAIDGTRDRGPGNGFVFISNVGAVGGPGAPDWSGSEIIRVGQNSGATQKSARAVSIENCALFGLREHVSVHGIGGRFRLSGCNTQELRESAAAIGMNTQEEASILTASGIIPVSAGFDTHPDTPTE